MLNKRPITFWFFVSGLSALLMACDGSSDRSATDAAPPDAPAAGVQPAADAGFSLDYEKFTLDNGLEVVLQVDRSDPIVAFSTIVHAGSSREVTGRTGFAHFFEHMAFNDSENVPRGWNRAAIPEWGGARNGGTSYDYTIYYEVVPKDAFDKIMWIDSDRLGYMINTVTQDALEAEIQVVKNEKRQRVDNAAYGYTGEVVAKNLYPEGHPYSWTVIGSLPDLQSATLDDLKAFYDSYYGAGNATLAIVGDIDLDETREKVEQWFGEIRSGPELEPLPPMPVTLDESRSLYFEDNFARLPQLRMTFPTVESYHPDEAALNALAQILGSSKNSPLYREVVEVRKLAPDVASAASAREIAGEFIFAVTANAGTDLDDVKAAIDEALALFEEEGIDAADLERVKAEQETALYANLSTVLGKANQMAADNEFAGDPAYAEKSAAAINALTVDDVMAAYRRYIADRPYVMTSFVPRGQVELSVAGSVPAEVWIEDLTESSSAEEVVTRGEAADYQRTPSEHDRSEPPFGDLPLIRMPDIWQSALPNDVGLQGIAYDEVPLVAFEIVIEGGAMTEPLEQKGLSALLARLMNEGTATRTAAELEQAAGLLGSQISVSSGDDQFVIRAATLARNFDQTVALVEEVLSSPRFEQADFERVQSALVTSLTSLEGNPTAIARFGLTRLLYGDRHPLGVSQLGSQGIVSGLTLDDVRAQYARLAGMQATVNVVGDIEPARAREAFAGIAEFFSEDKRELPEYPIAGSGSGVYFIDVPGSAQSVLGIGRLTVSTSDPDASRLVFANEKLGGGISGDLAQTLRIEKGYTYGASSGFLQGLEVQPFLVQTSVRANATGDSLAIVRDMLRAYGPTLTDADVQMTQQKIIKASTRAFEAPADLLNTLRMISKYGKSTRYVEEEQQELLAMSLEDYRAIISEYLPEDGMTYLIVGDQATQLGAVREFAGGDVVVLDIYGEPLAPAAAID